MSSNRTRWSVASASTLRLALAAALLTLAGCGRREAPPPPRPSPTPRPPVSDVRPLSSASYVATAASIDLYHISAGELALGLARDGGLRDYAARLISDHRGTSSQLSFAGRRLNLLPPRVMAPQHQAMIDALGTASDFDSLFRRQQLDIHRSSARIHSAFAARGDSQTLRPVAANAAAVEALHLAALRNH